MERAAAGNGDLFVLFSTLAASECRAAVAPTPRGAAFISIRRPLAIEQLQSHHRYPELKRLITL